jgi:hypothetical protein
MNAKLALRCRLEKIDAGGTLPKWLDEVKRIDDLIRAERADFDAFTKTTRDNTRRSNMLSEPSRCANVTANPNNSNTSRPVLPKLTSVERQLLYDNEGCLKCRRVFVAHRSTDCPNNFPEPTTYKPLTQSFVELIRKRVKKPVAAIAGPSNNDEANESSTYAPIATVMGMSSNPTAYAASNLTNVIEGDSLSDDSVSNKENTPPVPFQAHASSVLTAMMDDVAPLTVPHLYWRCAVSGPKNEFPVIFKALMDHGADTVFISEAFATSLCLKHRKLNQDMSVEMAMPGEGKKQVVTMSEWVKLQLYDPLGGWQSKTIRAVIAPSLCSPVILGLPFLSHNKIIVDHQARTAIAKDSGFDLLNPKPPAPKPPPKKKLKEFFRDLQEDRKIMLAELKMVCAERACQIGSDVRIIPTNINITAEDLAVIFFNNWYCENGLPDDIVCDCDKIFVSRFWKALTKLSGVKLKMSTAYHPETDGSSERSNKTINQMLRYHVRRNQKGWVRALPRIRFQIMNTVNASTGFSGFQLHLGRSPRVMPQIVPNTLPLELQTAGNAASDIIRRLTDDVAEARDNLLLTKITQAYHTSASRAPDPMYNKGDMVMLSTANRRHEYKKKGEKRSAKFFPRWDGPYRIINSHPEASTYTLDIRTNTYPVYHTAQLKKHHANDNNLFPSRQLAHPGPIVTSEGFEEYSVEEIIDSRRRGRGYQFLVRWLGYGPEHDEWIASAELNDCEALDRWYQLGGDGPDAR